MVIGSGSVRVMHCVFSQSLASITDTQYSPAGKSKRSSLVEVNPFGPVQLMETGFSPPLIMRLIEPFDAPLQLMLLPFITEAWRAMLNGFGPVIFTVSIKEHPFKSVAKTLYSPGARFSMGLPETGP